VSILHYCTHWGRENKQYWQVDVIMDNICYLLMYCDKKLAFILFTIGSSQIFGLMWTLIRFYFSEWIKCILSGSSFTVFRKEWFSFLYEAEWLCFYSKSCVESESSLHVFAFTIFHHHIITFVTKMCQFNG
jgi:hypothetical protein